MLDIIAPKVEITKISDSGDYGEFIVSPFVRGYGTTLANCLRRVLLSSVPGTAVSNIKIHGLVHEFTSIPGVKEDVIEIILNLKRLAIKNNSERFENRVAYINAFGTCEVKASDIKLDGDLEIINQDLHIATLSAPESKLSIELTITSGRGYVSAEKNKEINSDIGTIAIDSIYTPIERVNFLVEDTRVGNMTDYDKLIMQVWTNGTITASQAVSYSAELVIKHLKEFLSLSNSVKELNDSAESRAEIDRERLLQQPIEELEFSVRAYNCLKRAGINTIGDLTEKTEDDMSKVRNLGKKSFEEIIMRLAELGMKLKSND